MKILAAIMYKEAYVPPRCRKPRIREVEKETEFFIEDCKKEDMKLALTVEKFDGSKEDYYYANGKFYKPTPQSVEAFTKDIKLQFYDVTTYEKAVKYFQENAFDTYINVDGEIYHQVNEPIYKVCTFGLGNNHGGTALMIGTSREINSYCFNALQRDEAIAFGKHVAKRRGDTNDIDRIGKGYNIIVHLPEAVTVNPQESGKQKDREIIKQEVRGKLYEAVGGIYCDKILDDDALDEIVDEVFRISDYDIEKYYRSSSVGEALGIYLLKHMNKLS